MLVDKLDATTLWGMHVQSQTINIGGVPPTNYGWQAVPSHRPSWLFWTGGSSAPSPNNYPAVEFYPAGSAALNSTALGRAILPNTGNLAFSFDCWLLRSAQSLAHVIESDVILVIGGMKYNLSGQRHIDTGQIDIGDWSDTGIRTGVLTPNERHEVKWTYSFDVTKKVCSVVSYQCDSTLSMVGSPRNMPATACNWPDGAYIQFQLGSLPAGGAWAERIDDVELTWW